MTWRHFKKLMEQNKVPDHAILRITDPEEGGLADITGIVYGPHPEKGYTVEFYCDEP